MSTVQAAAVSTVQAAAVAISRWSGSGGVLHCDCLRGVTTGDDIDQRFDQREV